MLDKFEGLVNRLVAKIEFSQTPVPGFMIGLSGSDSILAFLVLYEALQRRGMEDRLVGIHYKSGKPTWFENDIFPWLGCSRDCHEAVQVARLLMWPRRIGGKQY